MVSCNYNTLVSKKSKINISDFIITILVTILIIILVSSPSKYAKTTYGGLQLFALNVFPTLFPFIFLSKIISSLQTPIIISSKLSRTATKVFRSPPIVIYVFFLSIVCGYPIGAKLVSDLYDSKTINQTQAKTMSYFCSTSGILFVVGTIGNIMFGSSKIGVIIYVSHIIGCFIGGLVLSRLDKHFDVQAKPLEQKGSSNIFSSSVWASVKSILIVGAYITLFCLFSSIICDLFITRLAGNFFNKLIGTISGNSQVFQCVMSGIIEMTNGCYMLSRFISPAAVVICCGLVSFGGFSIILQSLTFLKNTKIKARTLVLTKFVHAIFSILTCLPLVIILGV